jgi:hypothetical protein
LIIQADEVSPPITVDELEAAPFLFLLLDNPKIAEVISGVTFDGTQVWFGRGEVLVALDPNSGRILREIAVIATCSSDSSCQRVSW